MCGEAFLQPLDRATQRVVLHQGLARLLPDLQLFVLRKGGLVSQTVTLEAGNRGKGGRLGACQTEAVFIF